MCPSIQIAVFQLIFALSISISISISVAEGAEKESIYDILRANALPMGLLPKGVKKFEVDETGGFVVYLDQACNAKYESELHYEMNVTGKIGYGWIGGLSGISAQELFLWFPVMGIRVDVPSSGVIYFDVGVVRKQFSMSLFETPRDCVAAQPDDEIHKGLFLTEAIAKIQSSKLGYELDQEGSMRNIL